MIGIDPRHGSSIGEKMSHDLVPVLKSLGVDSQPMMLDSGDAFFLGNGPDGVLRVGVELKLVSDFVSSMLSGRLSEQIGKMSEERERMYLILEGFYRANRRNGLLEVPRGKTWRPLYTGTRQVFWTDVERYITGLEEVGVRIRRTRTPYETAQVIARVLYAFWDKPYDEHRSLHGIYRPQIFSLVREDDVTRRVRQVAACLPGIGAGRSRAVAEAFGSIIASVNASQDEWQRIDGIGKKLAGDVVEAIRAEIPKGPNRHPTPPQLPTGRVSQGRRAPAPSARHARRRQNRQLDTSAAPQRRVRDVGRGRRKSG